MFSGIVAVVPFKLERPDGKTSMADLSGVISLVLQSVDNVQVFDCISQIRKLDL